MSRKTSIIPLVNGAMLYLQENDKLAAALTFESVQDAKIVERTWKTSIPKPVPHTALIDCVGKWPEGIPVEADTICAKCGKKWIEH